jgi:cholesterol transport system auxiliary component
MRTDFRRAGLLALLLSLSACGTPGSRDAPRVYLLAPSLDTLVRSHPEGRVISVGLPQSAPGFDRADMLYARAPHTLEAYTQSIWADTPARMLLPLLVRRLEAGGAFAAVLAASATPIAGELRLDSELLRLQQEFPAPEANAEPVSQVRLALRVQLLDMARRAVLATRVFEIVESAPSDDAAGGVEAANRAVSRLLDQVAEFAGDQANR